MRHELDALRGGRLGGGVASWLRVGREGQIGGLFDVDDVGFGPAALVVLSGDLGRRGGAGTILERS